jgi:hypothetical protein
MVFNERKRQTFEFFASRQWVRVPVYAVAVSMYPIRSSYRYLKKLHKYHYLSRGHDITGRLVYRLSPRGAMWLLKRHQAENPAPRPRKSISSLLGSRR